VRPFLCSKRTATACSAGCTSDPDARTGATPNEYVCILVNKWDVDGRCCVIQCEVVAMANEFNIMCCAKGPVRSAAYG
jgi:hypothetical protein